MDVILQGDFDHFRPDELLTFLSSFRHSGVLEITAQDRHVTVFFDDGALIHAESNTAGAPVAALVDIFTWQGGSFTFSWPPSLTAAVERSAIDLEAVVGAGRELLAMYPNERLRLHSIDDPAAEEIHLSRDEYRTMFKLVIERSIRQLRADLGRSASELYPVLQRLESAGLLERRPAQDDIATVRNVDIDASVARFISEEPTYVPPPDPLITRAALTLPNGDVLTLVDDVYLIGRDPDSQILINDASVSSCHARIVRNETGYLIEDAESRNGTFVNGEKISGSRTLSNADVVRLGKMVVTYNEPKPGAERLS